MADRPRTVQTLAAANTQGTYRAIKQKLTDLVNKSGFPFQIGIASLVRRTIQSHGWNVLYTEHAWSNQADQSSLTQTGNSATLHCQPVMRSVSPAHEFAWMA